MAELDVLRDKLYSEADAGLRRRIDEALDPLRIKSANLASVPTPDAFYTPAELVNLIADAYMDGNRERNRARFVSEFLDRVRKAEREGGRDYRHQQHEPS